REEDEAFWQAQQERAQRRREQQAVKDKQRAAEREIARAKREKEKQQQQLQDEKRAREEEAAKKEEKRKKKAEMDSKREKAEAVRARAFELCREGNLPDLRPMLEKQDGDASAPSVKLSDRRDGKGKSGATLLHMCVSRGVGEGETSDAVMKGRLEVATYLLQGTVKKDAGGERDRVDLSK
ncbi:unnamed protein product, partial [Ectocarpus sp. 12 AP-2014]